MFPSNTKPSREKNLKHIFEKYYHIIILGIYSAVYVFVESLIL